MADREDDSRKLAGGGLARFGAGWSIEAGYEAWDALRETQRQERARLAEERRKLEDQGRFLLGAVRAAAAPTSPPEAPAEAALAPLEALPKFVAEAEAKLKTARESLEARAEALETRLVSEEAALRANLRERVARFAEKARPLVTLRLQSLGASRRILQADRLSPDHGVLVFFVLTGRIPSRYGFLHDDATDDLSLPPAPLYADEGVKPEETRPDAVALRARFESAREVAPVKTFLPVLVPGADGGVDFFRLLQRGAVMEAELAEGDRFRNILATEEAERLAGHFLRLKLEGKLELELET